MTLSIDDIFQVSLRSIAAIVWLFRLHRARRGVPTKAQRDLAMSCLALVLTVIAVGAFLSANAPDLGPAIRISYTTTSVVVLIAGLALWRKDKR